MMNESLFNQYRAAWHEEDDERLADILEFATQDPPLERKIFFFHVYEIGEKREYTSIPLQRRTSEAELRSILETAAWEFEQEEGEAYAAREDLFLPLGRQAELCSLPSDRLQAFLISWIENATVQTTLYYVGMSYDKKDEERIINLLPLFLRPSTIEREQCKQAKRLFLTLKTFPTEFLPRIELALEILMYWIGAISGYAHGRSLPRVKNDTLINGEEAQYNEP